MVLSYGDKAEEWSIVNGQEPCPSGSNNHKVVKGWVNQVELGLNEVVSGVGDSQLVHTRVSMDPSVVWERLASIHMSQGLGSIISVWQRFFQLKKLEEVTMQVHTASIHEHADCLTGLGDSPSETLMVTVLLISLPEPYSPLIISLDIRNLTLLFSVVSMRKHVNFLVLVQLSLQVKILPSMQSASLRRTKRMLHVSGVGRRDTTGTSVRKIWMRMPVESRWRRARSL